MKQDPNYIPDLLYGTILQMMQDKRYFYDGFAPEYSHWTDEGKRALEEFFKDITPIIQKRHLKELDERAKEMVMETLKEAK